MISSRERGSEHGSKLESAQTVSTALLREPVKQAVREALYEEAAASEPEETIKVEERSDGGGSGRSKLSMAAVLVTLGGLIYFARKRFQSGSDDMERPGERQGEFERSSPGNSGSVGSSTATVGDET